MNQHYLRTIHKVYIIIHSPHGYPYPYGVSIENFRTAPTQHQAIEARWVNAAATN